MKSKLFILFAVAIIFAGNAFGADDETSASPVALIAKPVYEFEPVVDGTQVMHDYVIQNKGAGILEIQKVKTG